MTTGQIVLDIAYAVFLVAVGWYAGGWLGLLAGRLLAATEVDPVVRNLLRAAVRPVVVLVVAVAALDQVGAYTGGLLAVLGTVGVAIGLGLKGSLSNVASGALLLSLRPFNIGDLIEVAGVEGRVRELGLFTITITTQDGQVVTVLNDKAVGQPLRNLTRLGMRRADLKLVVKRGEDLAILERRLIERVSATGGVVKSPAPTLIVTGFTPEKVTLLLEVWAESEDWAPTLDRLRLSLLDLVDQLD